MLGVLHEDEAAAAGGLQAGDAGHGDGTVSEETAAEIIGEIAQASIHGCLLSLYEARVTTPSSLPHAAAAELRSAWTGGGARPHTTLDSRGRLSLRNLGRARTPVAPQT